MVGLGGRVDFLRPPRPLFGLLVVEILVSPSKVSENKQIKIQVFDVVHSGLLTSRPGSGTILWSFSKFKQCVKVSTTK